MDDWLASNPEFYYAQPLHPMNGIPNNQEVPKIPQTIQPKLINESPKGSPSTKVHINESVNGKKEEDKRQLHLQSEKRRREKIQTSYKYLEGIVVPILGHHKLSRAELLRRTADLVKDMHQQLNSK